MTYDDDEDDIAVTVADSKPKRRTTAEEGIHPKENKQQPIHQHGQLYT